MVWLLSRALAVDCVGTFDNASLSQRIEQAREAATQARTEDLEATTVQLRDALPCTTEVVTPELAADLHFAEAFVAYRLRNTVSEQERVLEGHLCAVAAIAPDYDVVQWVVSDSHPLARRMAAATCEPASQATPLTDVFVDGAPTTRLPADRPFILQVGQPKPTRTEWVPRGAIPADVLPVTEPPPSVPAPTPPPKGRRVAGIATAIGGAGLAAVGTTMVAAAGSYWSRAAPTLDEAAQSELETRLTGYRAVGVGVGGLGIAGLGVGTALILVK